MDSSTLRSADAAGHAATLICAAVLLALAVAMGVGRFAFTPMFPLMVRDGLLDSQAGAWLAAANYLGYLAGALTAGRLRVRAATLLGLGLIGTLLTTAAVGWTGSLPAWALLRFVAGALSAWVLVATTAWGLGWLSALGRANLAGLAFSGVGLGIAAAGLFCMLAPAPGRSSSTLWIDLAVLAAIATLLPLAAIFKLPVPPAPPHADAAHADATAQTGTGTGAGKGASTGGLILCYSLFGFGYILPATYLPALARQLVDDPYVFGLAWPLFGAAAAVSTVVASWRLGHVNRVSVWAVCHVLMALGVLLPAVWTSLAGVSIAALLVGGTFMVITMVSMQEVRARAEGHATLALGRMTAGFALGQLAGPLVNAGIARMSATPAVALQLALMLSAAGLLASGVYLLYLSKGKP